MLKGLDFNMVHLDRETGRLSLPEGVVVDETTSFSDLPQLMIGVEIGERVLGREWVCGSVALLGEAGERISAAFYFFQGFLRQVLLVMGHLAEEDSWRNWDARRERDRKAVHDRWLSTELGNPPFEFKWGDVESILDRKSGFALVAVRYKGATRSGLR